MYLYIYIYIYICECPFNIDSFLVKAYGRRKIQYVHPSNSKTFKMATSTSPKSSKNAKAWPIQASHVWIGRCLDYVLNPYYLGETYVPEKFRKVKKYAPEKFDKLKKWTRSTPPKNSKGAFSDFFGGRIGQPILIGRSHITLL